MQIINHPIADYGRVYPTENLEIVKPHVKIHFPIMEMVDFRFRVIGCAPRLAIRRIAIADFLALAKSDRLRAAEKTPNEWLFNLLRLVYKYYSCIVIVFDSIKLCTNRTSCSFSRIISKFESNMQIIDLV